ncbi:helix-turn-helix domain-containing protein [Kitasatospora griseola]|uniref:helix-turn-helix domain-containing protein n=1 Tax=Kitasatospora griseola TaxID=2064 RepID=UPI003855E3EF
MDRCARRTDAGPIRARSWGDIRVGARQCGHCGRGHCGCALSRCNISDSVCGPARERPSGRRPRQCRRGCGATRWCATALAELDFGGLSKRLRDLLQLHQDEVAYIIGVTQGYLSRLESGRARLTHIDRIVSYLAAVGTPPDLARLPLRAADERAAARGPPLVPVSNAARSRCGRLRSPT